MRGVGGGKRDAGFFHEAGAAVLEAEVRVFVRVAGMGEGETGLAVAAEEEVDAREEDDNADDAAEGDEEGLDSVEAFSGGGGGVGGGWGGIE